MDDARIPLTPEDAMAQGLEWTASDPQNPKAWSRLAYAHEIQGQFKAALQAVQEAARLDPSPEHFFKWGRIAHRDGDYAGAAGAFERAAQLSIAQSDRFYLDSARVAQAHCLALAGQSARAAQALEQASPDAGVWLGARVDRDSVLALLPN